MRRFPVDPPSASWQLRTAQERFRAGDRRRFYGSVLVSLGIHVLLFLAWPELTPAAFETGRAGGASPLELYSLAPVHPRGEVLTAVTLVAEEGPSAAVGTGGEPDDASGHAAAGNGGDADPRSRALERIAAVSPGVVERRTEPPPDPRSEPPNDGEGTDPDPREGRDVRLPAVPSDLEERLSDEELLRLERLTSLQPELAFGSTSSWLVVQNPHAVREFIRRRFPAATEAGGHGSLSVSLWIDEGGSVEWAEINRSSGRPDLDQSALELFEEVVAFGPARQRRLEVPTAAIFWLSW